MSNTHENKIYRLVKFSNDLPTGDYIVIQPHGRVSNYHHVNEHEDVIGIEWVFEPITLPASIGERAKELIKQIGWEVDLAEGVDMKRIALQLATEAVAMKDAEIESLKNFIRIIHEGYGDHLTGDLEEQAKQLLNS